MLKRFAATCAFVKWRMWRMSCSESSRTNIAGDLLEELGSTRMAVLRKPCD